MPPRLFHFCDMWIKDPRFLPTVNSQLPHYPMPNPRLQIKSFFSRVKAGLLNLHRNRFADLQTQQLQAKAALEKTQLQLMHSPHCPLLKHKETKQSEHYITITTLALDLIRQQSKADWVGYGDDCTRYFFTQISQGKLLHIFMIFMMIRATCILVSWKYQQCYRITIKLYLALIAWLDLLLSLRLSTWGILCLLTYRCSYVHLSQQRISRKLYSLS